jgi:hypothetical protein
MIGENQEGEVISLGVQELEASEMLVPRAPPTGITIKPRTRKPGSKR